MLSISDWIAFLTSEKNPNIGIIVGFSAFILAAFAAVISVTITNNNWAIAVGATLVSVALLIFFIQIIGLYGRHAKMAGQLLDEIMSSNEQIMSGDERDPLKIEKRWKELSGKGKKEEKKSRIKLLNLEKSISQLQKICRMT